MRSFFSSNKKDFNTYTIAFYNVENLFDIFNDPKTLDDDYTATGKRHWNTKRYKNKIRKLSNVISQLGTEYTNYPPAIVGLVEVENAKVIQDLINHKNLEHFNYGFVHYDSPDERGIDVALLYNKKSFQILHTKTFPLLVEHLNGNRDYTRDILLVKGKLNNEIIYVLVNHWPSHRETGVNKHKRILAAALVKKIIAEIKNDTTTAKIIVMGDFNDNPKSKSVKEMIGDELYNPMESLLDKGIGSTSNGKEWNLFDQIIFSKNFFTKEKGKHHFTYATVFNKKWLRVYKGKLKGTPFRTYIGPWYKGGFSDHFPVYIYLKKES